MVVTLGLSLRTLIDADSDRVVGKLLPHRLRSPRGFVGGRRLSHLGTVKPAISFCLVLTAFVFDLSFWSFCQLVLSAFWTAKAVSTSSRVA
jgi:hypothetical protein